MAYQHMAPMSPEMISAILAQSHMGAPDPRMGQPPGQQPMPQPGQMVPERPLRMGPTGGPFGMSGETLDNVARAVLQASQQFQPRNDFEGFLGGLAGGLAGGRVQDMHQRGQFNQREQDRADVRTQANVKSEDERRQFVRSAASSLASHRQQLIRDRMQEEARAAAAQTAYERELPDKRAARESNERVARIHASNKGGGSGVERFDDMTKLDVQSVRDLYTPQVKSAHEEVAALKKLRAKAGSLGGKSEVLAATGAKDLPSAISALDAEISKAQAEAVRVGQEMKQAVREAATGKAAEPPYVPAGVSPPAAPVQGQGEVRAPSSVARGGSATIAGKGAQRGKEGEAAKLSYDLKVAREKLSKRLKMVREAGGNEAVTDVPALRKRVAALGQKLSSLGYSLNEGVEGVESVAGPGGGMERRVADDLRSRGLTNRKAVEDYLRQGAGGRTVWQMLEAQGVNPLSILKEF